MRVRWDGAQPCDGSQRDSHDIGANFPLSPTATGGGAVLVKMGGGGCWIKICGVDGSTSYGSVADSPVNWTQWFLTEKASPRADQGGEGQARPFPQLARPEEHLRGVDGLSKC